MDFGELVKTRYSARAYDRTPVDDAALGTHPRGRAAGADRGQPPGLPRGRARDRGPGGRAPPDLRPRLVRPGAAGPRRVRRPGRGLGPRGRRLGGRRGGRDDRDDAPDPGCGRRRARDLLDRRLRSHGRPRDPRPAGGRRPVGVHAARPCPQTRLPRRCAGPWRISSSTVAPDAWHPRRVSACVPRRPSRTVPSHEQQAGATRRQRAGREVGRPSTLAINSTDTARASPAGGNGRADRGRCCSRPSERCCPGSTWPAARPSRASKRRPGSASSCWR